MTSGRWPVLDRTGGEETSEHLRLCAQMVGKTCLALAPPLNHWWHVALSVTARGLTTRPLSTPACTFDLELDLLGHALVARTTSGRTLSLPLGPGSVSAFYARYVEFLDALGVHPPLHPRPVESVQAIPFPDDHWRRPYEAAWVEAYFGALVEADRLLKVFRGGFLGKASPVHVFWGAMDLATTRFSGRRAPRHPGGVPNCPDEVMVEAYSHECASAGFWPGGGGAPAAFYAYAYPEPKGFARARVLPRAAFYSPELREFLLPYEAVRTSADPDDLVLSFLESTYVAAAELGAWPRAELEREHEEGSATMKDECEHLARVERVSSHVKPSGNGCVECLATDGTWVHLRLCLTCGHVGCCDNSPMRHATKHFHATKHPVIKSFEPGEDWAWCYVDKVMAERIPASPEERPAVHYAPPA